MTLNDQIKIRQEIDKIVEKAIDLYDVPRLRDLEIRFDIRSFNFVGQARQKYGKLILRLNPKAIVENFDDMLNDTIPHEIAHLVTYINRSLGKNHNRGWQRICLALGGNGKRCIHVKYDLDAPTLEERKINHAARRPYVYTDSKGTDRRVTKQKHIKIQRRGFGYRWRDNGGRIDRYSAYTYTPVKTAKQAVAAAKPKVRAVRKPQNRKRKGQMSKADIARNLIKLHYPAGSDQLNDEQIIAKMMDHCNFKKGLAKSYFNHYLPKAF